MIAMSNYLWDNLLPAELPLLFAADFEDILKFIVPAIFAIIWVISQVLGATDKNKQQQPRQQRPQQLNPPNAPPQQEIANEIDAFLKKIQQAGAAEPKIRPPAPAQVVEAELVEPALVAAPPARNISNFETRARSTSTIGQRHLMNTADDGIEEMERHRHEVFDHELGSLQDTSSDFHESADRAQELRDSEDLVADSTTDDASTAPAIPTSADEVREMFADAQNVRKAVILSEVFASPSDRW